ncbi:hypothetical protein [Microbacterium sp.]
MPRARRPAPPGTLLLRDRSGIPLGPENEAEQAASPIYGMSRA